MFNATSIPHVNASTIDTGYRVATTTGLQIVYRLSRTKKREKKSGHA